VPSDVYGVALIALALLALALSHRLQDPESTQARAAQEGPLTVLDTPAPLPGHAYREAERIH
jgi:hypothetical protein